VRLPAARRNASASARSRAAALLAACLAIVPNASAQPPEASTATEQGPFAPILDPEDGMLDLSETLSTAVGFLPIPTIITEPAVGYGGGIGALFLHDPFAGVPIDQQRRTEGEVTAGEHPRRKPPSMSFAGGGGTANGTWYAGGGHQGFWLDDRLRYTGALLYSSINLDFFGPGGNFPAIPFSVEGIGLIQELKARIGDTDLFLGGRYVLLDSTTRIAPGATPGFPNRSAKTTLSGIGPVATFTTLDNVLTPHRGIDLDLRALFYNDGLGSDFNYQKYDAILQGFWDPHPRVVIGALFDGRFSRGRLPFYTLPSVQLRGVPALRYQGEHALSGEFEVRWRFLGRWSAVGFAGVGGTLQTSSNAGTVVAGGGGFRYLIARLLGLEVGLDVAVGEEDTVVYIQVGNAWGSR